jgi:hypothetical protein
LSSDNAGSEEKFGWRILRPPPPLAVVFGVVYGAIAGAVIVYDVTVLVRTGKLLRRRVGEEVERRRGGDTE